MSLIYNPSPIFMKPRNSTVDLSNVFNLEFVFNGYICKKVLYQFYDGDSLIGNGTSIQTTFAEAETKYNTAIIKQEVPIGHLDNIQYTNIGWRCYVFGEYKSMTVDSAGNCTIPNHGYSTGDLVNVNISRTVDQVPYMAYVYVLSDSLVRFFDTREKALSNVGTPLSQATLSGKQTCPMAYSIVSPFTTVFANTLTLDKITITMPIYTFIPHFTNTQVYIPRIYKWKALLYSNVGIKVNGNGIIEESNEFFNGLIKYQFKNALFSGNVYGVRFIAYDVNNYEYDTGIVYMDVLYDTPSIGFSPVAVNNCLSSSISVEWGGAVNINGVATGDYEYIHNFYEEGNSSIHLKPNATLSYSVDIPKESPPIFIFSPYDNLFDGEIMRMENELTGDYASFGYSQEDKVFKYDVNGIVIDVDAPPIDPDTPTVYNIYKIALYPQHVDIKMIGTRGDTV